MAGTDALGEAKTRDLRCGETILSDHEDFSKFFAAFSPRACADPWHRGCILSYQMVLTRRQDMLCIRPRQVPAVPPSFSMPSLVQRWPDSENSSLPYSRPDWIPATTFVTSSSRRWTPRSFLLPRVAEGWILPSSRSNIETVVAPLELSPPTMFLKRTMKTTQQSIHADPVFVLVRLTADEDCDGENP